MGTNQNCVVPKKWQRYYGLLNISTGFTTVLKLIFCGQIALKYKNPFKIQNVKHPILAGEVWVRCLDPGSAHP